MAKTKDSAKRYYWLKLKENFFEDDTIQFIEEQENGKEYLLFYLKLCLKSLTKNGKLYRLVGNKIIPYDVKSLAKLTNTNVDTVNTAMALFKEIGIIDILDTGELYMSQIDEMIGSETNKAQLMRDKRARDSVSKIDSGNNVTEMLPHIERELDLDTEKELDTDKKKDKKPSKKPTELDYSKSNSQIKTDILKEFVIFRKEDKKKPVTQRALTILINEANKHTDSEVTEAINKSISCSYQGVFYNSFSQPQSKPIDTNSKFYLTPEEIADYNRSR